MSPVSERLFLRPSQKASSVLLRGDDQGGDAIGVIAVLAGDEDILLPQRL